MTREVDRGPELTGEVLDEHDDGYVVRVTDARDEEHRVLVTEDGDVLDHASDALDGVDLDTLSPAEQDVIQQIHNHARYRVHEDTDQDLLDPVWQPDFLRRVRRLIDSCDDATFGEFEPYYHALQNPPIEFPKANVLVVFQPITLTADRSAIADVQDLRYLVQTDDGDTTWRGPNESHDVALHLPTYRFEWPFGSEFREFLVNHVGCQLRDAYIDRGQQPPNDAHVEGFGKLTYAGEHLTGEPDGQ
ncbi:hypothetical protein [Halorubellus sp. PRR65]|uniref:hypothetical protein n=1 Tax=Halorubellus sp. PRR65 TaxID=3098148 RepID=UPI002B256E54|nr:hypothetical protein [Halorubellus sp. PRR65]